MRIAVPLAAIVLVVLVGCETPAPVAESAPAVQEIEPQPQPAPPPPVEPAPPPVPSPGERALTDGIVLYDAGDFNGAIKRLLGAKEIWTDSTTSAATATKVAARKYVAFSYCVTKRRTLCRQQFVDAFKLDPRFDLQPTEKTHPVWGVEFERARKQASAPAAPAKRVASPDTTTKAR